MRAIKLFLNNNYYNLLTHCIVISHERYIVRSNIRVKSFRKSYEFLPLPVRIFHSRSMERSGSS